MTSSEKDLFLRIFDSIDFEKIKDHPNILIAANFWDEDRYQAARTCYKFMRAIDDLIDDYKAQHRSISEEEAGTFEREVSEWLAMMVSSQQPNPDQRELSEVFRRYRLPLWTMEDFARSMIYDIHHDSFATLDTFIDYAGGASVAPASVFVHLAGLRREGDNYLDPLFDVRKAAMPCAVFSYLVHIIRDFQKDQLNNLTYFAGDIMSKHHVDSQVLYQVAHGGPVTTGFRDMVSEYLVHADIYRAMTLDKIREISPLLGTRYRLSLEVIFELYLMVFERIDVSSGSFTAAELNPSASETKDRVYKTILNFQ